MLKRWLNNRVIVLSVGVLAIAALIVLSAGLASFKFDPTTNNLSLRLNLAGDATLTGGGETQNIPWVQNLIMFVSALLIAIFIISLFNPDMRKWLLRRLPYLLVIIALAYIFAQMQKSQLTPPGQPPFELGGAEAPLPLMDEGYIPPQVSLASAFAVALLVLLIVAGVVYYAWLHRPVQAPHSSIALDELGGIVQAALNDLDAGRAWDDTIIQCYVRMSEIVNVERGLQRQQAMTPSEFAERLIRAGLPASAVQRLTRLFEAVRYGAQPSTPAEVDEAVACLRTIVDACGGAA